LIEFAPQALRAGVPRRREGLAYVAPLFVRDEQTRPAELVDHPRTKEEGVA